MDGGKLSSKTRKLKNFPYGVAKINFFWVAVVQFIVYGVLALVAFRGATSAVLENFEENIDITFLSKKAELIKEEKALQK